MQKKKHIAEWLSGQQNIGDIIINGDGSCNVIQAIDGDTVTVHSKAWEIGTKKFKPLEIKEFSLNEMRQNIHGIARIIRKGEIA